MSERLTGRTGRRPGVSGAREAILEAARGAFTERGYERATIRVVAASAGVDPALVHHYFGNKRQLFVAAMSLPVNPAQIIEGLVAANETDTLGERTLRTMLTVWDDEVRRAPPRSSLSWCRPREATVPICARPCSRRRSWD